MKWGVYVIVCCGILGLFITTINWCSLYVHGWNMATLLQKHVNYGSYIKLLLLSIPLLCVLSLQDVYIAYTREVFLCNSVAWYQESISPWVFAVLSYVKSSYMGVFDYMTGIQGIIYFSVCDVLHMSMSQHLFLASQKYPIKLHYITPIFLWYHQSKIVISVCDKSHIWQYASAQPDPQYSIWHTQPGSPWVCREDRSL